MIKRPFETAIKYFQRFAGWVTCFAPSLKFVKIELKGPDNTLRLRQVKALGVLGGRSPDAASAFGPSTIQQANCEAETLRVFRLITSQVFGRLLEQGGGSSDEWGVEGEEQEETDLKEHVVGILFVNAKLTHLQKQVCAHIVAAIRKEAVKIKEDWLLQGTCKPEPDAYCFEMLSLVLALSGSSVGRTHLATQHGLIQDLIQVHFISQQ